MKEIGKLIELLNEYERKVRKKSVFYPVWFYDENIGFHHGNTEYNLNDEYVALITSKKYGFIKWLVENDKIDRKKLSYKNIYMSDYGSSDDIFLAYNKGEQGIIYTVDYYETILMLLSISSSPIDDLLSYLK